MAKAPVLSDAEIEAKYRLMQEAIAAGQTSEALKLAAELAPYFHEKMEGHEDDDEE